MTHPNVLHPTRLHGFNMYYTSTYKLGKYQSKHAVENVVPLRLLLYFAAKIAEAEAIL